jgi:hypothetical protein
MTTTTENLVGSYYPAAPGARTIHEARALYIGTDRVTCNVDADRKAYVFVGLKMVFAGELPAEVAHSCHVNPWARDVALAYEAADAEAQAEAEANAKAEVKAEVDRRRAKEEADRLRAEAREQDRKAYDSFESCDTDGFLSQWAAGRMSALKHLEADLVEMGGKAEFAGLFDLDGNLVPAVRVDGRWGASSWKLLNERGRCAGWFNESQAKTQERRLAAHKAKGYYVGRVRVPARAELVGNSAAPALVRVDDWNADAEIVDNGQ